MARKTLIVILILAAFTESRAQQFSFLFTAGMAAYSMSDMKKLNEGLQSNVPFKTEMTSNFPVTPQFGGQFTLRVTHGYALGLIYSFNSTGSRIASSDYSGSYRFDNVLTAHTIGFITDITLWECKAFSLNLEANIGLVYSRIRMSEDLQVADTLISSAGSYSSLGVFIEPRLQATYHWKLLKGGLFCSYLFNPGAKIKDSGGQKSDVTVSWSGLRLGVLIGIQMGKAPKRDPYLDRNHDNE